MIYSGDKPNPNLKAFVEAHSLEHPFDPTIDRYDVAEFSAAIETTKNSPIFSMHSYHLGKKPHDAVATYINHHTAEGDLVLDPFCGSGSTALASLIQGRKAVALDISPAATFITRFYVSRSFPEELAEAFKALSEKVRGDMELLYGTRCHVCGAAATIHYVVYSNVYNCPECGKRVSLYEAARHSPPSCPHCRVRNGREVLIRPILGMCGNEPVAVNFSCRGGCTPKRMTRSIIGSADDRKAFLEVDLPRIRALEEKPIPHPFPDCFMMHVTDPSLPWGDEWRPSRDFRKVSDLFTHRNLWALAACMAAAGDNDDLRAVITSAMPAVSRKAQHLEGGGGYIPGNWALPPMSKQRNVMETLTKVFKRTLKAKTLLAQSIKSDDSCISTQSATAMAEIPSCSIDYIFTDPPYGGSVQYGELNFVWEAWLGLSTRWHGEEIIVNRSRGKTAQDWADSMTAVMAECYRVLKPGRWLSLCYHDSSDTMWRLVQEIMLKVGFVPGDASAAPTIDTGSRTYNQRTSDKVVKRDLVIGFRKPRPEESRKQAIAGGGGEVSFHDKATETIRAFLSAHPGVTKDRIYDHLISVMIRTGPMEDLNFEKLLSLVASRSAESDKGWFLK
jgi:DNA modification methylase